MLDPLREIRALNDARYVETFCNLLYAPTSVTLGTAQPNLTPIFLPAKIRVGAILAYGGSGSGLQRVQIGVYKMAHETFVTRPSPDAAFYTDETLLGNGRSSWQLMLQSTAIPIQNAAGAHIFNWKLPKELTLDPSVAVYGIAAQASGSFGLYGTTVLTPAYRTLVGAANTWGTLPPTFAPVASTAETPAFTLHSIRAMNILGLI